MMNYYSLLSMLPDKLALLGGLALMAVSPAVAGESCLARYYDAEHLRQHLDQLVTGVTLLLKTQVALIIVCQHGWGASRLL
jgi:hypothetical protein